MSPRVTDKYKEQKKQRILEAAKSVFIRNGYRGVTMKDVVDASGLSRGGVYLYFSNTEEIFSSLIEASDDNYSLLINQISNDKKTAWEGVVQLIEIVMNNIVSIEEGLAAAIYEYFLVVNRKGQVRELLMRRLYRAIDSLRVLLNHGIENGEFHPVFSIDEISKFLLFVMDGVSINMIHLGEENVNVKKQADQLILYLQKALQVNGCDCPAKNI
jgi:AcrR family transcriptional regulator